MMTMISAKELKNPLLQVRTTEGDFFIILFPNYAPETCHNFLKYVEDEFYDNTIFHRVVKNYLIQGGGLDVKYVHKKTLPPIPNESRYSLSNNYGRISMVLPSGKINSATSQFFINLSDNDQLNFDSRLRRGFTVFGEVIEGMEVVVKISQMHTYTRDVDFYGKTMSFKEVPKRQVVIKWIRILRNEEFL